MWTRTEASKRSGETGNGWIIKVEGDDRPLNSELQVKRRLGITQTADGSVEQRQPAARPVKKRAGRPSKADDVVVRKPTDDEARLLERIDYVREHQLAVDEKFIVGGMACGIGGAIVGGKRFHVKYTIKPFKKGPKAAAGEMNRTLSIKPAGSTRALSSKRLLELHLGLIATAGTAGKTEGKRKRTPDSDSDDDDDDGDGNGGGTGCIDIDGDDEDEEDEEDDDDLRFGGSGLGANAIGGANDLIDVAKAASFDEDAMIDAQLAEKTKEADAKRAAVVALGSPCINTGAPIGGSPMTANGDDDDHTEDDEDDQKTLPDAVDLFVLCPSDASFPTLSLSEVSDTITFGRAESRTATFKECKSVSREHCTVTYHAENGDVTIEDTSMTGVYVDGERMPKAGVAPLKVGSFFGFIPSARFPNGSTLPTYTLERVERSKSATSPPPRASGVEDEGGQAVFSDVLGLDVEDLD